MNPKRKQLLQLGFLLGWIAVVTALHYLTSVHKHVYHDVYRRLYYVPIIFASYWWGIRGGIAVPLFITVIYLPHVIFQWGQMPHFQPNEYLEIVMYNGIGWVAGMLSSLAMRSRRKEQEAMQKMMVAEKLAALGQLSAGLAHEIKNPLGGIKGAFEIIAKDVPESDKRHEFCQIVRKEMGRLETVVSNFVRFASPGKLEMMDENLNDCVRSAVNLVAAQGDKQGIRFSFEPDSAIGTIRMDVQQFRQVLLNVLLNAMHSMQGGGLVTVKTFRKNGYMVTSVSDQGCGIPPESASKLFEPFFSTKKDGTGLGLSIAYQIMSEHGGHIEFASNPDRGATFYLLLPSRNPEGGRNDSDKHTHRG